MSGEYKFGIEEEYFLVDAETKSVSREMPAGFLEKVKSVDRRTGEGRDAAVADRSRDRAASAISPTPAPSCASCARRSSNIAAEHGLAILAVGTHPTATWRSATQTPAERYDNVMEDLQMIGQRNMLCGLHVHVELPDPDDRVDIMMRMLPYLPLFIALGDLLAVLARAPDRAEGLSPRRL